MFKIKWNHLYYLLAAFDVLAVSGSLYLNHQIMGIYSESVDENRVWVDRTAALEGLRDTSIAVNAPGNNVFDDKQVSVHQGLRDSEYLIYKQRLKEISDDYKQIVDDELKTSLLGGLDKINAAMTAMNGEADSIFEYFNQGQVEAAGSRMATMDRKAANVQHEIGSLIKNINLIQDENFKSQLAYAQKLKQFEYVIAIAILLMVIMVTIYGHKLAKTLRDYQKKLEDQFRALSQQTKLIEDNDRRSRSILEAVADGIIIVDTNGKIESMNLSAQNQFGYQENELLGLSLHKLMDDQGLAPELVDNAIASNTGQKFLANRKNGEQFHAEISVSPFEHSGESKFTSVIRDVTESKKAQDKLQNLAMNDPLTGLTNRNGFAESFDRILQHDQQASLSTAVMLLDLDRFKNVNDTYGHPVGDKLLVDVSTRIKSLFRNEDIVARLGGDEFAVVLGGLTQIEPVKKAANRLLKLVSKPYFIDELRLDIGTSIGISLSPDDDSKKDELIRKGDLALYQAKELGRGTYQFFTPAMHETVASSKKLESRLRIAFENNLFELHYQPQINTDDNSIYGCEVLIRWRDEEEGYIGPDKFIPLAEQSDLIKGIDHWVLKSACHQWVKWKQQGMKGNYLSINVSVKTLEDHDFINELGNVIEATGILPGELQLELTETAALNDMELCIERVSLIHELGVSFAVDDFGTGHSSLTYLRRLPLDTVKIDRSFINDIFTDPIHEAITEALIKLGDTLGVKVIAEGIEDEVTKHALEKMGCHLMQGYYFHKPLPLKEFEALVFKE